MTTDDGYLDCEVRSLFFSRSFMLFAIVQSPSSALDGAAKLLRILCTNGGVA